MPVKFAVNGIPALSNHCERLRCLNSRWGPRGGGAAEASSLLQTVMAADGANCKLLEAAGQRSPRHAIFLFQWKPPAAWLPIAMLLGSLGTLALVGMAGSGVGVRFQGATSHGTC